MRFGKKERTIKRLLIVEDEPLVAFDNEHLLGEAGYLVVATVDNVAGALAALKAGGIDLVLADLGLSNGGDGLEVARAAHAGGVPVLLVTGSCPAEAQAIAVGCLAKPYAPRTLKAALDAVEARLTGAPERPSPRGLTLYEGAAS
jgi:two-component system, response regulator PdtaR